MSLITRLASGNTEDAHTPLSDNLNPNASLFKSLIISLSGCISYVRDIDKVNYRSTSSVTEYDFDYVRSYVTHWVTSFHELSHIDTHTHDSSWYKHILFDDFNNKELFEKIKENAVYFYKHALEANSYIKTTGRTLDPHIISAPFILLGCNKLDMRIGVQDVIHSISSLEIFLRHNQSIPHFHSRTSIYSLKYIIAKWICVLERYQFILDTKFNNRVDYDVITDDRMADMVSIILTQNPEEDLIKLDLPDLLYKYAIRLMEFVMTNVFPKHEYQSYSYMCVTTLLFMKRITSYIDSGDNSSSFSIERTIEIELEKMCISNYQFLHTTNGIYYLRNDMSIYIHGIGLFGGLCMDNYIGKKSHAQEMKSYIGKLLLSTLANLSSIEKRRKFVSSIHSNKVNKTIVPRLRLISNGLRLFSNDKIPHHINSSGIRLLTTVGINPSYSTEILPDKISLLTLTQNSSINIPFLYGFDINSMPCVLMPTSVKTINYILRAYRIAENDPLISYGYQLDMFKDLRAKSIQNIIPKLIRVYPTEKSISLHFLQLSKGILTDINSYFGNNETDDLTNTKPEDIFIKYPLFSPRNNDAKVIKSILLNL